METDPYLWTKRGIEQFKQRMQKQQPDNYKYIEDYLNFLYANNRNPRTIYRQCFALNAFFKFVKKDAKKISKNEMVEIISKVNSLPYKPATIEKIHVVIKSFYKHLLGDDVQMPMVVAWIKTKRTKEPRFDSGDLLNEEDIIKMIDAADSARDKAIIATLWDSGCRPVELLNMRIADVDLTTTPPHINLRGKTGLRSVAILFAAPYLGKWLDLKKNAAPSAPLWTSEGHGTNKEEVIKNSALNILVKRLAKKAGVVKPKGITAYLFRHSHLSMMAMKVPESVLRRRAGWTGDSEMPQVYIHLSGKQDDEAFMQANGIIKKKEEEAKPRVKVCQVCGYVNEYTGRYCARCGNPLDLSIAEQQEKLQKQAIKTVVDPEYIAEIVDALVEQKLKQKAKAKE